MRDLKHCLPHQLRTVPPANRAEIVTDERELAGQIGLGKTGCGLVDDGGKFGFTLPQSQFGRFGVSYIMCNPNEAAMLSIGIPPRV